jgi:aspartyl-tRNA(Asn)/glutamyl-tRNA(Gln) amidotransferase subunit B
MNYESVIGLEIHVRVKSQSKMFCGCKNAVELADAPNIHVCPVCMWFPGMLPAINKEVVRLGVIAGMMMNCEINTVSRFDRKSYFYPDLPNSFQTTQMYEPIVGKGRVDVLVGEELRTFEIHHMHLENDAGKLSHAGGKTLCDYNRAGSPLMEIVTMPVFRNKEEVMEFLKELQKMFRAAGVSDADMEKWQLRCDVNMSIRPEGDTKLYNRTEHKNVNSFSAIGRCIDAEFKRQVKIVQSWKEVVQETRGWDDETGVSSSQRSKEDAMDYRYVPEPDILPIVLDEDFIHSCRAQVVELPIKKRLRYLHEYGLGADDARILTADASLSQYFDTLVNLTKDAKKSCSFITSVLLSLMKESQEIPNIQELPFTVEELAHIIALVNRDELSSTNAKIVVWELFLHGGKADIIIDEHNLRQKNDFWALESIVDLVLWENIKQIEEYKAGKENLFGYFVGQCMKQSKGQGNPKIFTDILLKKLK